MILSRACENAIRALLYLAGQKERNYVPIKEIAEKNGISFHFLGKILQILTQQGILISYKGPNGGIAFAKTPEKIKVIDIIQIIDGMRVFDNCVLGLPECGGEKPCSLHSQWEIIRDQLKDMFSSRTLAELARE